MYRSLKGIVLFAALTLPIAASSQVTINPNQGIGQFPSKLQEIFNLLSQMAIVAVIIFLLYGVFIFATGGDNENRREKGKQIMLYSLVGIFIIGSLLSIVNFITTGVFTFTGPSDAPDYPQLEEF